MSRLRVLNIFQVNLFLLKWYKCIVQNLFRHQLVRVVQLAFKRDSFNMKSFIISFIAIVFGVGLTWAQGGVNDRCCPQPDACCPFESCDELSDKISIRCCGDDEVECCSADELKKYGLCASVSGSGSDSDSDSEPDLIDPICCSPPDSECCNPNLIQCPATSPAGSGIGAVSLVACCPADKPKCCTGLPPC